MPTEQELKEAINILWGWMGKKEALEIVDEEPWLAELCISIHREIDHPEDDA